MLTDVVDIISGSKDDTEAGTDVDGDMANSTELRMDMDSPSSELEKLHSGNNSETESIDSGTSGRTGKYEVNAEDPGTISSENLGDQISVNVSSVDNDGNETAPMDVKDPGEKKLKSDRRLTDSVLLEKRSSDGSSGRLNESFAGSRPSSVASSGKSSTPGKDKGIVLSWSCLL